MVKQFIAFVCLLIPFSQIRGQDSLTKAFLEQIIRKYNDTSKIYYADSALYFNSDHIYKDLNGKIKSLWKGDTGIIKLTKEEKMFIKKHIQKDFASVWSENLFKNSKRIKVGETWKYIDSFGKWKPGWTTALGYQVWSFSNPIFLRNNNLCLVSWLFLCGRLCGQNETSFYKNVNGRWEKWIVIEHGDF